MSCARGWGAAQHSIAQRSAARQDLGIGMLCMNDNHAAPNCSPCWLFAADVSVAWFCPALILPLLLFFLCLFCPRGHLRTNAAGANLNREWDQPSYSYSPEVGISFSSKLWSSTATAAAIAQLQPLPYL